MRNPTRLGEVMTDSSARELIAIIRRLTGEDIEARALAIAAVWPLGAGLSMAAEHNAKRQQAEDEAGHVDR